VKITPILHLPDNTTVIEMFQDPSSNSVLLSLSDGRVLKCDEINMLASLTGVRTIMSGVQDGFGFTSSSSSAQILYALHNRIIEINSSKAQIVWKSVEKPMAATAQDLVTGVFTSQTLWAGEDFGFWDKVYWEELTPSECETLIYVRTAELSAEIESAEWVFVKSSSGSIIQPTGSSSSSSETSESSEEIQKFVSDMDSFNLKGNYLQVRIELNSRTANSTPTVFKTTVSYRTKHSVYFFTQKFNLDQVISTDGITLTGSYTQPQNTEMKFGVATSNSADWDDYTIITPDQVSSLPSDMTNQFKIGVKFTSCDDTVYSQLDEFSVMLGGDKQTKLNE